MLHKGFDASLPVSVDVADIINNRRHLAAAQIKSRIFPRGKLDSGAGISVAVRDIEIWRRHGIFSRHSFRPNATLTGGEFRCDDVRMRAAERQMSVFRKKEPTLSARILFCRSLRTSSGFY